VLVIVSQAGCLAVGLWMEHQYTGSIVRYSVEEATQSELEALVRALHRDLGSEGERRLAPGSWASDSVRHKLAARRPYGGGALIVDGEWRPLVSSATDSVSGTSAGALPERIEWTPSDQAPRESTRWGTIAMADGPHVAAVRPLPQVGGFLVAHRSIAQVDGLSGAILRPLPSAPCMAFVWLCALLTIVVYLFLGRYFEEVDGEHRKAAAESLRQRQHLERTRDAVIFGLAKLADSRDPETGDHLERISVYSTMLANALRRHPGYAEVITPSFVRIIGISSVLHDIGKVGIEDRILRKPGPFTPAEIVQMRRHTIIGGECIRDIEQRLGTSNFLQMAREITFAHHERWDGTGYPHGLRGEEIPLAARIVAIVDVYDALSSRRVYKSALPHGECVAMIRSLAGTHFDPALVEQWLMLESTFHKIARRYGNQEPADDAAWIDPEEESLTRCKEALVAAIAAGEM